MYKMSYNKRLLSPLRGWDSQKRCAYFACPKGGRYGYSVN